jgi:hypothetical protein
MARGACRRLAPVDRRRQARVDVTTRADAGVRRVRHRGLVGDVVAAGLAGAACSAVPSTVWSLVRGEDVLDGARAAGAMVLPHERRTVVLVAIAAPVHLAISLGWAAVMAVALPRRGEPGLGIASAMAIATLDLALIGRRIPSIASLPQGRQWADHAAYGLAVGWVLRARRSRGSMLRERFRAHLAALCRAVD